MECIFPPSKADEKQLATDSGQLLHEVTPHSSPTIPKEPSIKIEFLSSPESTSSNSSTGSASSTSSSEVPDFQPPPFPLDDISSEEESSPEEPSFLEEESSSDDEVSIDEVPSSDDEEGPEETSNGKHGLTDSSKKRETRWQEEKNCFYDPDRYYPVRIGEVFQDRFRVIGKLGYGMASTVWLCKDQKKDQYVVLKVFIRNHRQAKNELRIFRHLRTIKSDHRGANYVRTVRCSFKLKKNDDQFICLVHDPLGVNMWDYSKDMGGMMLEGRAKGLLVFLLKALDYLHTEAQVIHTDLNLANVICALPGKSVLRRFEEDERKSPSPSKTVGDRTIYKSRKLHQIKRQLGLPQLCDFGDAQIGGPTTKHRGDVMPDLLRAPEVILDVPWDEKIDIWALGCTAWQLFNGKCLFTEWLPTRAEASAAHLAKMIALLGPPPRELLRRGYESSEFFEPVGTEDCRLTADIEIPKTSFEDEEWRFTNQKEPEKKAACIAFIRRMLKWLPEERASAKELLDDPFLREQRELMGDLKSGKEEDSDESAEPGEKEKPDEEDESGEQKDSGEKEESGENKEQGRNEGRDETELSSAKVENVSPEMERASLEEGH